MIDEVENAKTIKECYEIATCDAYGESEIATGWMVCLDEILGDIVFVKFLGEKVSFVGFDIFMDSGVIAKIKKGKEEAKVSLDSIKLLSGNKQQKLWLKAYNNYTQY